MKGICIKFYHLVFSARRYTRFLSSPKRQICVWNETGPWEFCLYRTQ